MTRAIYPGTFDPITRGHLDLVERASRIFEEVLVAVGENPAKAALFSLAERLEMVRQETAHLANVRAVSFSGLLVKFAREQGVRVVLRGVRGGSDLEEELRMAAANRSAGEVETLFFAPRPEYAFISGRLVKEIAASGGDVSAMVSPAVARRLRERLGGPGSGA